MKGGLLAGLTTVAALLVLGSATAGWATITTAGAVVEDVRLPDEVTEVSGASEAPASVAAAATAFLTVLPLALVGVADRSGAAIGRRTPGTVVRMAATLGGVATAALAAIALLGQFSVGVAVTDTLSLTPAIGLFGLGAALVLVLSLLAWRVPRTPRTDAETSRYTVEAVRGEVGPTSDDDEPDEWDLAVDDDTDHTMGEGR